MTDLSRVRELVALDHGLSVIVTLRADHTPQTSVVNAGVLTHPVTGAEVVAFVAAGRGLKLVHLRADATTTVVVRAGWQWVAVEGEAELIGPDDPHPDVDDERLRVLLRDVFTAAGGTHDDWATYDNVMREERRTAVLVTPTRLPDRPVATAVPISCMTMNIGTEDGLIPAKLFESVRAIVTAGLAH